MIKRVAKNRITERRKITYTNPCYNIDDIFKFYKKSLKTKNGISKELFKEICYEYNKELSRSIVEDSAIVKLPYRLGELSIRKRKMNYDYLKMDYNHFRKTGKQIFHLNSHSDEWKARWFWSKRSCIVINKTMYSFVPTCSNKKALANVMLSEGGHRNYFEN